MAYHCEVFDDERIGWLLPTLRKWGHFVEEYCEVHPRDTPYHYTERANVGTLCAAAWAAGCTALAEYQTEKMDGENAWNGRADLYIYSPAADWSVGIEAKQLEVAPGTTAESMLQTTLKANNDAVNVNDAAVKLAATFFVLRTPDGELLDQFFDDTLHTLSHLRLRPHLLAYSRPAIRQQRPLQTGDAKVYWPGVILFLRRARRMRS